MSNETTRAQRWQMLKNEFGGLRGLIWWNVKSVLLIAVLLAIGVWALVR
jgi:hypothetical protein